MALLGKYCYTDTDIPWRLYPCVNPQITQNRINFLRFIERHGYDFTSIRGENGY